MPTSPVHPTLRAEVPAWVQRLARSLGARVVRTHISWVLVGRREVWKLKQPLRLDFLDASTLDARRHLCHEELRLNRRLAAPLYLGVVPVTGSHEHPQLGGPGPVIDHAVHMRRFADGALLDERLAAGTLDTDTIDRLAARLAGFHQRAPFAAADSAFGRPERVARDLCDVVRRLAQALPGFEVVPWMAWLEGQIGTLAPAWAARRDQGRVREVHGDLHLANLVDLEGEVTAFDAIEFDPALRCIDVASDIAFPVMDLQAHGRPDLAMRLLDGWLTHTGDHGAVPVLRAYLVYRALVRALVRTLTDGADPVPPSLPTPAAPAPGPPPSAWHYVAQAQSWRDGADPRLLITEGLPGSGKTWVTTQLLQRCGAIRLRSDVERKRLCGLAPTDRSDSAPAQGLYTEAITETLYAALEHRARGLLQAGWPLIIDASFSRAAARRRMHALARSLGVPFAILSCEAPDEELQRRLHDRQRQGLDASDADAAVLAHARRTREPMTPDEQALALCVGSTPDVDDLARRWRAVQESDDGRDAASIEDAT